MKCAVHRAAFPDLPAPTGDYILAGVSVCDVCRSNLMRLPDVATGPLLDAVHLAIRRSR